MSDVPTYRAAVLAAHIAARILAQHPIRELLQDIERADAVGPLFNPTLWMEKHAAMEEDRELLQAALSLAAIGRKLKPLTETDP